MKNKKVFRVGIVGCGGIAQTHAAALDASDGVELVAAADIRIERAQAMAERYGAKPYVSLEEMLQSETLDAVHICTPHHCHVPMAQLCAEHGVAVFMEKPPVISYEQWEALCHLQHHVPVGVCFQNRYNANYRDVQRMVSGGELGKVTGARAFVTWRRDESYYTADEWRGHWETEGGGALINQAIHTLDQMLGILGMPDGIVCHMANEHLKGCIEVEDTVEARFTFGDAAAVFYATTAYAGNAPVMLEFQCEKATMRLEDGELHIRWNDGRRETRTYTQPETLGKGYWGNGHSACIGDFYEALRTGRTIPNNVASVENTALTVLEMYRQGKRAMN